MSGVGDEQIVGGLRAGSGESWRALYETYFDRVWRLAGRMIGPDRSAIADVVQETFLSAARSAQSFNAARGSLWLWLAGIVRNTVGEYFRRRWRERRAGPAGDARGAVAALLADRLERASAEPLAETLSAESADLVRSTLAGLPDEHRAVLSARYLEDTPMEELARQADCSVDALRSRLARARRAFRDAFTRPGGSQP